MSYSISSAHFGGGGVSSTSHKLSGILKNGSKMRNGAFGTGQEDNNSIIHLRPPVDEEHLLDDESSVSIGKSSKESEFVRKTTKKRISAGNLGVKK